MEGVEALRRALEYYRVRSEVGWNWLVQIDCAFAAAELLCSCAAGMLYFHVTESGSWIQSSNFANIDLILNSFRYHNSWQ
jgi:hypothetical protein